MHWVGNRWGGGVYVGRLFFKMAAAHLEDCSDDDCGVVAHIRDILELLSHYQWIYDVKITELFKERTWEKLPADVSGVRPIGNCYPLCVCIRVACRASVCATG